MKSYLLLSNPDNWYSGSANAIDSNGNIVSPNSSEATKWSMLGSIYHCYGQVTRLDRAKLYTAMLREGLRPVDPAIFNQHQRHATVVKILEGAGL